MYKVSLFFKKEMALLITCILFVSCLSIDVLAESWLYDKGKWYYYYTFDEPVEKQWITYNGNEYYIGSKGLMATDQWINDENTGKKCYVGINGVKQKNTYTYNKDKFVGEDGTQLVAFDNWRKEAKANLKAIIKALNKKTTVTSQQKEMLAGLNASDAGFSLYDINGDGYKDIIVVNKKSDSCQVLDIQLWNQEDQKFYAVMELDYTSDESAVIKQEPDYGDVWMIITKDTNDVSFHRLKIREEDFKNEAHFHCGYNDYGDIIYYIDDDEVTAGVWHSSLLQRERDTGSGIWTVYHDLDEQTIKAEVDTYPTDLEITLFSEYDEDD
jgi:hypothetical protein